MNILCISHEYPPIGGGGATACRSLTRAYAAAGHTVTLLTARYRDLPARESADGVAIVRVPCKRAHQDHCSFAEMFSFLCSARKALPACIAQTRPDVIHVFFGIPSGPLALYAKKKYGIPYVVRLGGGDIPGTQKRFAFAYKIIGPFLKQVWRQAACVVANSEGLLARAQAFSDRACFEVIPNGIAPADFAAAQAGAEPDAAPANAAAANSTAGAAPESGVLETAEPKTAAQGAAAEDASLQGTPEKTFSVCSTARIVERKGLQDMVAALPACIAAYGRGFTFTVLGDGPYRAQLEQQAAALGVSQQLHITGFLSRTEVLRRLPAFDAYVCPSRWEGMPNTVLEAMASGLPVVMTACEGSAELIRGNGFVIPLAGDVAAALAEKLLFLAQNDAQRAAMGRAGKERVLREFTWDASAQKYLTLLEKAVRSAK